MREQKTVFLVLLLWVGTAFGAVDNYEIDPVHSFVLFKVNHLGFSETYGRFTDVKGHFKVDEAKPEKSSLNVEITTNSVNTHNKQRDKHLKGPDFFNSKIYKNINFVSQSVKKKGDNVYQITGELSLHGKKKSITIDFHRQRTGKDPWGKFRTGGEAKFKIKRSEFGMSYMQGENSIGDEVELIVSIEGFRPS